MKRNIKLLVTLVVTMLVATMLLTACSGDPPPPEEEEIIQNIQADIRNDIQSFLGDEDIVNVEVIRTEINEEETIYTVRSRVESESGEVASTRFFVLSYVLDEYIDEDGRDSTAWFFDSISPFQENTWTTIPIRGVDDSEFRNAIMGISFTIDGDHWSINDESLDRITVSSRNTQLEESRDSVVVDVALSSAALVATGQIELDYVFEYGWRLTGHSMHTAFTSDVHPNAVFEMTDERALDKIIELRHFVFSSGNTAQDVLLNREQISNVSLVNSTVSNMGTHMTFEHSFNLEKDMVSFEIDVHSTYNFDALGGWALSHIDLTPRVTEVRLDGTSWGGIYTHSASSWAFDANTVGTQLREFRLELSELPAIGGVRAVLTELSTPYYSQHLFGREIDFDNLSFSLEFEEWIVEASWTARRNHTISTLNTNSPVTFNVFINVENSTLVDLSGGWGPRGNSFGTMTQQQAAPPADAAEEPAYGEDEENGENGAD